MALGDVVNPYIFGWCLDFCNSKCGSSPGISIYRLESRIWMNMVDEYYYIWVFDHISWPVKKPC